MSTVVESLLISLGFDADTSGAKGFMGTMDGVVGKALSIASVVGGIFTANSFIKTASTFEQLETQLTTIQGSSEKAKESMNWISEFAAETPYELQQVADAFVKLQSYGMDAQEGGLLESIGNMASGMNKSLDQAVEAIADAVTGENERLKEFGIRAEKDKKGGTTYTYMIDNQAMTKTASKAPEDIQRALQEIMDERFKDAMKTRAKTWEGTLSNMADIWQMFQLKVMKAGVFDALKDKLNRFMMWIAENKKKLDEWAKSIGDAVTYVFERIDSMVEWIYDWTEEIGITDEALIALKVTLGYVATALLGLAAVKTVMTIFSGLSLLFSPLMLISAAIGVLLLLIDDFMAYGEGRPSVIGRLVKDYPQLQGIIDGFKTLGVHLGILWEYASEFLGELKDIFLSVFDINEAGDSLGTMFGFAFDRISEAIKALLPILGFVVFAVGFIIKGWIMLAAVVAGVVATIIAKLVSIVAYIVGAVANAIQWFANLISTVIPDAISRATEWFKKAWDSAISYVSSLFQPLFEKWDTIKGFAQKVGSFVGWGDEIQSKGLGFPNKMTPPGNTSVTQNVNVNVPTAAAAGDAVTAMGNSARHTVSKSQAGVRQ